MSAPLLLDLSHTSHTRARTGIQRVTRSLHRALGERAVAITHDPYHGAWRTLEAWERANLAATTGATKRGARWPLAARLRGRLRRLRLLPSPSALLPVAASGVVVPEVFSPAVAAALPQLFASTRGPRVALFHDAIALKLPELSAPKTVARFPAYLVELLQFDGIAAVSEDSRTALIDYWSWLRIKTPPPVQTLPLAIDTAQTHFHVLRENESSAASLGKNADYHVLRDKTPKAGTRGAEPVVLSIGSIEGRKNHEALLEACERLWSAGERFSLHLIGLAQPQTGGAALARMRALQAAGRPLRYDGPASDAEVDAAYAACTFSVYPSLMEGFGLPVLESLAHGKPCICSARGALGESARGGGCVALEHVDATSLSAAIAQLLRSPPTIAALAAEARARKFKSWTEYAEELLAWIGELKPLIR